MVPEKDPDFPTVYFARTDSERLAIYRFRYRIYTKQMGAIVQSLNHEDRTLKDELDETGVLLYVRRAGRIAATLRINLWRDTPFPSHLYTNFGLENFSDWPRKQIAITTSFIVAKGPGMSEAMIALSSMAYQYLRLNGILFDFTSCPPSALPYCEQLGYRYYGHQFVTNEGELRLPMVLLCEDVDFLQEVRSPILPAAKKLPKNQKASIWFIKKFPFSAGNLSVRTMSLNDFWMIFFEKIYRRPQESMALLKGLEPEEASSFLSFGKRVQFKKGTQLGATDFHSSLFVIIEGTVGMFGTVGVQRYRLANFGPGQAFGALNFFSKTSHLTGAEAMSDVELLEIDKTAFETAMLTMPAASSKVLFNISMMLCDRLRNSIFGLFGVRGRQDYLEQWWENKTAL